MTWQAVARKDFQDAIRSRTLLVIASLFVVLPTLVGAVYAFVASNGTASGQQATANLLAFVGAPLGWLVPLVALLVGYSAIAGERESGSIKLLLSLPHQRRDVVFGKLVGRTLVVATAVVAGFGATALVGLVLFGSLAPVALLGYSGLTVAFAAAYVSIAVGFSAVTPSSSRAAAGAVGAFALFSFVWEGLPRAVHFVLEGSIAPTPGATPAWYSLLSRLSPNNAYDGALELVTTGSGQVPAAGGSTTVFASWWFGLLVLCVWIVGPALLGYVRFEAADL